MHFIRVSLQDLLALYFFARALELFTRTLNLFVRERYFFARALYLFARTLNLFARVLYFFARALVLFAREVIFENGLNYSPFIEISYRRFLEGQKFGLPLMATMYFAFWCKKDFFLVMGLETIL